MTGLSLLHEQSQINTQFSSHCCIQLMGWIWLSADIPTKVNIYFGHADNFVCSAVSVFLEVFCANWRVNSGGGL